MATLQELRERQRVALDNLNVAVNQWDDAFNNFKSKLLNNLTSDGVFESIVGEVSSKLEGLSVLRLLNERLFSQDTNLGEVTNNDISGIIASCTELGRDYSD